MKYFLCICVSILLSSCFWLFWNSAERAWLIELETDTFTLFVPNSWQSLAPRDLPTPTSWETVLALKSVSEREGYFNNLIVLKNNNSKQTNSKSLMQSTETMLQKTLKNYKLIQKKDIVFPDDETWIMLTFSGRYNSKTPITRYIQTAKVCWDSSYFATISVWEVLESYERYEEILETFACK